MVKENLNNNEAVAPQSVGQAWQMLNMHYQVIPLERLTKTWQATLKERQTKVEQAIAATAVEGLQTENARLREALRQIRDLPQLGTPTARSLARARIAEAALSSPPPSSAPKDTQ